MVDHVYGGHEVPFIPNQKQIGTRRNKVYEHLDYCTESLMDKLPTRDKFTFFQNILHLDPAFT